MSQQQAKPCPVVLCFSGHDPSGGAGIQADIEAVAANGAHAITVTTALTIQDSRNVEGFNPVSSQILSDSAACLLADMPVACFKIGMLGDASIADAVAHIIKDYPQIPVVLDPVLSSGAGTSVADSQLLDAIQENLLPLVSLVTPNSLEAKRLTNLENLEDCARELLGQGCRHALITGTHVDTSDVINTLYSEGKSETLIVERLEGEYHGSGCTLASSIAAQLALGEEMSSAVRKAIDYTWQTLKHARPLGRGQLIPNRFYPGVNIPRQG